MKKFLGLVALALPLCAQSFDLKSLDRFAPLASDTVDVTLDGPLLQLAAKFLSNSDPDEAKIKRLVGGLKGIYVRSFEFEKEGVYTPADVDGIRSQIRIPEWSRIVGVKSKKDGQNAEIFLRTNGTDKVSGITILMTAPKGLTVVQIAGTVNLDDLSDLSGNFGVPNLELDTKGSKGAKGSKGPK